MKFIGLVLAYVGFVLHALGLWVQHFAQSLNSPKEAWRRRSWLSGAAITVISFLVFSISLISISLFACCSFACLIFMVVFIPCRRSRAPPISRKVKISAFLCFIALVPLVYLSPATSSLPVPPLDLSSPAAVARTFAVVANAIVMFISAALLKKFRFFVPVLIGTAPAFILLLLHMSVRAFRQSDWRLVCALIVQLVPSAFAYFYGLINFMANSMSAKKCLAADLVYLGWVSVHAACVERGFGGALAGTVMCLCFIVAALAGMVLIFGLWPFSESGCSGSRMKGFNR
jgi:hypothetical protein